MHTINNVTLGADISKAEQELNAINNLLVIHDHIEKFGVSQQMRDLLDGDGFIDQNILDGVWSCESVLDSIGSMFDKSIAFVAATTQQIWTFIKELFWKIISFLDTLINVYEQDNKNMFMTNLLNHMQDDNNILAVVNHVQLNHAVELPDYKAYQDLTNMLLMAPTLFNVLYKKAQSASDTSSVYDAVLELATTLNDHLSKDKFRVTHTSMFSDYTLRTSTTSISGSEYPFKGIDDKNTREPYPARLNEFMKDLVEDNKKLKKNYTAFVRQLDQYAKNSANEMKALQARYKEAKHSSQHTTLLDLTRQRIDVESSRNQAYTSIANIYTQLFTYFEQGSKMITDYPKEYEKAVIMELKNRRIPAELIEQLLKHK